jgi:hypothetical protein
LTTRGSCSSEKYLRKLIGRNDIEGALKRLDKLTQEEARMATAEVLKVTHSIDDKVKVLIESKLINLCLVLYGFLNFI